MRQAIRTVKVITPARLLKGLSVGVMLVAGTALYFNLFPESEAGSLSSSNQVMQAFQAPAGSSTVDRTLSNIELERMDYEEGMMLWAAAHNPTASNSLSKEIERLETHIDRLLADAAGDPSRNTPSLNREIERLDDQIDLLRLNAAQDRPSYEQQRAADSLEERLEVQRVQQNMFER